MDFGLVSGFVNIAFGVMLFGVGRRNGPVAEGRWFMFVGGVIVLGAVAANVELQAEAMRVKTARVDNMNKLMVDAARALLTKEQFIALMDHAHAAARAQSIEISNRQRPKIERRQAA